MERSANYAENSPYLGVRVISIRKYLSMSEDERKQLGAIEVVPPSLGSSSMGGIRILSNDSYPHK
jgi:hypothetical protein